ncbi:MAG: hypothetical protein AAF447_03565 [Myxococcota bacterium]
MSRRTLDLLTMITALAATACGSDERPALDLSLSDAGVADAGADLGADLGGDLGRDLGEDLGRDLGREETLERIPANTVLGVSTTWTRDRVYVLEGPVFVGPEGELVADEARPVLRIEAGTEIRGERGNLDPAAGPLALPGVLVVTRNGRIDAEGTAASPIVFTSARPPGERVSSDWGGVVLLGRGTNNLQDGEDDVEGLGAGAGEATVYGAPPPQQRAAWNCGRLRYVRIEFAGFELRPTEELNALTLGSCGSDTVLDNIHVHRGSDDGIEFFGGTVNATRLILTGVQDDSLDWDQGYAGSIQFVVVQQYDADESSRFSAVDSVVVTGDAVQADNGIEGDGLPEGVTNLDLSSNPTLFNLTFLGSPKGESDTGFQLRDGTRATIGNAFVSGFGSGAVDIGDQGAAQNAVATPPSLRVTHSVFQGAAGAAGVFPDDEDDDPDGAAGPAGAIDETDYFTDPSLNNQVLARSEAAVVNASLRTPDFRLAFTPTVSADTPPDDGFFDPAAQFIGALGGGSDFTAWTIYPED